MQIPIVSIVVLHAGAKNLLPTLRRTGWSNGEVGAGQFRSELVADGVAELPTAFCGVVQERERNVGLEGQWENVLQIN